MSLRGLLRHQVAIITPGASDPDDLDESGFPVVGAPSIVSVPAMIQPRDSHELSEPFDEGILTTDFIIFLEIMPLSAASYIVEADDNGPIDGGRRFQINGIQAFQFGSNPHLEVFATLTEGNFNAGLVVAGS